MSMAAQTTSGPGRRATYQDVLDAPPEFIAEILDGELVLSPRPTGRHGTSISVLGSDLLGPYLRGRGGPGGWWILFEPEVHLGEDVLVPDLAGWRRERMPTAPHAAFESLAPDWVCEVLSPSTARRDRIHKLRIYAREGVRHAWLVDPLERTVEVYRLQGEQWLLVSAHEGDEWMRAEPFDAVEIDLVSLWGEERTAPEVPERGGIAGP